MRLRSWKRLGLDTWRALAFVSAAGAGLLGSVTALSLALGMGQASVLVGAIAGVGASYLLLTAPGRALRVAGFAQTLEAPALAAAGNIYLASTASRNKTLLMVRAEEPFLASFLSNIRRMLLLGYDARAAFQSSKPEATVLSESVKAALSSVLGLEGARVEEGDEELEGLLRSRGLDDETRLPILIAVCFFLPIMVMLAAAMAGGGEGQVFDAALLIAEVVILDVTLAVSKSETSHLWEAA